MDLISASLMNGIELESIQFSMACACMNKHLQLPLAQLRRIDQHQAVTINWMIGADHSPLETTIAYEQVAIEVTAAVAQNEPDPYLTQVYRFGLLEDFDHMYRYSALLDRLEGKDSNNILQSYTDVLPGRPTIHEHRAPEDDLRESYNRANAAPLTKIHALTILSGEQQTWNCYMNIGPLFSDPLARQLYAEIAHIEEQHVTQYQSIIDSDKTWLEKWLLHKANDMVRNLFEQYENQDAQSVIPADLPEPFAYESQHDYVREVLRNEVNLRAKGTAFVDLSEQSEASKIYRQRLHADGVPSEMVALDYM
ncbi:MAG: hypothetical protein ACXWTN_11085 [Methylosarcina sp.]